MAHSNILSDQAVYVIGVGLHRYQHASDTSFATLGLTAVRQALDDAAIEWPAVEGAYVGNVRVGMAAGPAMLRYLGSTGIPIAQVENASATGSTAFRQAVHDVAAGVVDVCLAVGVDKPDPMASGPQKMNIGTLVDGLVEPFSHFAMLTQRYIEDHGATPAQIARVAVKNHRHGSMNPFAQRQQVRSLEEVLAPPRISGVLTRLQCTLVGEGAAAVIVASRDSLSRLGVSRRRAVRVTASASRSQEFMPQVNYDVHLTRATAKEAMEAAGVGPGDLDIIELHDAFTIEELLYLEAIGICEPGDAIGLLEAGAFDIGGAHAVSPSGGLIAMGHPTGPTGIGQVCEVVRQLRGEAGARQHPAARIGLTHMVGVGAVCVVHVLEAA